MKENIRMNNKLILSESMASKYKLSEYSLVVGEKPLIVFNTRTGALVCLDDNKLKDCNTQALAHCGIIVEKNENELQKLAEEYNQRTSIKKNFHAIVAVTMACNFKCFYCYESHPQIFMSDDVCKKLVKLVERKAKEGCNISIVWYGGEPLMNFRVIRNLSEVFIGICKEENVQYSAEMISNGYLFTDQIIKEIQGFKIGKVQVTLDGMKEKHNKRRGVIGAGDSFERVFCNLKKLYDKGIQVKVRINVDKTNIESAYELIDFLAQNSLKKADITLGMLKDFSTSAQDYTRDILFDMEEFSEEFFRFRCYLKKREFENAANKMYPKPKCNTCTLDAPNALVIAPDGQCYKCISQIGEQKFSIGKIDDEGIEYKEYQRYSPFQMKQCRECVYLPICKGGCLYNTCTGTYLSCDVWKYVTEKTVLEVAKEHVQTSKT